MLTHNISHGWIPYKLLPIKIDRNGMETGDYMPQSHQRNFANPITNGA